MRLIRLGLVIALMAGLAQPVKADICNACPGSTSGPASGCAEGPNGTTCAYQDGTITHVNKDGTIEIICAN